MKRKTAKEILSDSFQELAAEKSIDKITIRDITDNCGYSPATFYRNFKDKYDLIAWEYSRVVSDFFDKINVSGYEWKQTLSDAAVWFSSEKEYLANLLQHTTGHDSFMRYMVEINYTSLEKYILAAVNKRSLTAMEKMTARTYCLGTVGITCEWILGKVNASIGEISELYLNTVPDLLKKYLLN
ncbi:MAG: TetR family transcriptional regulator [Clostridia bacterium]|jgi:AcrR family transcriptional regulator|nr:TetR family transcriptional regulator [Clostridia bacterium]